MKKNILLIATIAFSTVCNFAKAQETSDFTDNEYWAKWEESHYHDRIVASVGDDPRELIVGAQVKHGAFIGLTVGGQMFDGNFAPMGGVEGGWEGKHLGITYYGTFAKGNYTTEADRSNPYTEFDSKLQLKGKVWGNKTQSVQLWLGAYGSYKLNFDYHKSENTYVVETPDEITTTTQQQNFEVKGSTMGYGAMAELVIRPFMSKINYRVYAGVGQQQRYYMTGNRWHTEFFVGVAVTYNFNASSIWNTGLLKKAGLSKKEAKKLSKGY